MVGHLNDEPSSMIASSKSLSALWFQTEANGAMAMITLLDVLRRDKGLLL